MCTGQDRTGQDSSRLIWGSLLHTKKVWSVWSASAVRLLVDSEVQRRHRQIVDLEKSSQGCQISPQRPGATRMSKDRDEDCTVGLEHE